jgi:hypothetical protein
MGRNGPSFPTWKPFLYSVRVTSLPAPILQNRFVQKSELFLVRLLTLHHHPVPWRQQIHYRQTRRLQE